MPSPISPIFKSLVRHCVDTIDEINTITPHQTEYFSWEQRAEEDKLPKTTLLGLDNFMFDEDLGLWVVNCSLGLSSYKDLNLIHEAEILDVLFDWWHQGQRVPLRDMTTGDELDQLVVTDFQVTPMVQSMLRNYRTVNLTIKRTSHVEP